MVESPVLSPLRLNRGQGLLRAVLFCPKHFLFGHALTCGKDLTAGLFLPSRRMAALL
jgi:hypothetical protein